MYVCVCVCVCVCVLFAVIDFPQNDVSVMFPRGHQEPEGRGGDDWRAGGVGKEREKKREG